FVVSPVDTGLSSAGGVEFERLADMDNDGDLDAILREPGGFATSMGRGDGTFGPMEHYSTGPWPAPPESPWAKYAVFLDAADFDDDSTTDIVAVAAWSESRILYRNDHPGRLTGSEPAQGHRVKTGDFNGDGAPDALVVLAINSMKGVSVSLNTGNGVFAPAVSTPVSNLFGGEYNDVGIADFNRDGRDDLAITDGYADNSSVDILLSNGDGSFTFATPIDVGVNTYGVIAGDFNGDGKADILVNTEGGVRFHAGQASGAFGAGVTSSVSGGQAKVAADFDNDGHLDVAVAVLLPSLYPGVAIYFGDGQGTFAARDAAIQWPGLDELFAVDFNGDGSLDVVAANGKGIAVAPGSSNGALGTAFTRQPLAARPRVATAGDFNGDGKSDVAVMDESGEVTVFSDSAGSPRRSFLFTRLSFFIAAADFDRDGHVDLITSPGPTVLFNTACRPRRLGIVQNVPEFAKPWAPFGPQPVASLRDDGNNLVCSTGSASATLLSGSPGPAVLVGASTVPLSVGQAVYSDLAVSAPGSVFRLEFAHGSARPTRSRFFQVVHGTISVSDATVLEGNAGDVGEAVFSVTLSTPHPEAVSVSYGTIGGTATLPLDFVSSSGTVTFAPWQTTNTIRVAVKGDDLDEADETFFVVLSAPSPGFAVADGVGRALVQDDDPHTDLWITKSDGTDTAAPGETLVYTITAGNAGPTEVLGAT
ncbi:MAG: FG-GAP-like repeat-containing protein, partial [bacterium]